MKLPMIRNLEVFPVKVEGETVFCLRDPEGYVEQQAYLSPHAFFIASCLNGKNTVHEVQKLFEKQFTGQSLDKKWISEVVTFLDENFFLFNKRFETLRKRVEKKFLSAPTRPAYFAGKSYPNFPDQLREVINQFFLHPTGPQRLPDFSSLSYDLPTAKGLITPHIDFQRGGPAYAHGYYSLFQHGRPDLFFVFGVSHLSPPTPFILTRKDFHTPLGTIKTNTEIVDQLAAACQWDPFAFEIAHRTEHSIEFQVVMLSYLYGTNIEIVPVLCGAFPDDFETVDASQPDTINPFINVCRSVLADREKRVTLISGVDLAHVGRRFGDPFDITSETTEQVRIRDHEDLKWALDVNPDSFLSSLMKDKNERRVCGKNCIYATLKILKGISDSGEELDYNHAPDPLGGMVSFTSILYR